MFINAFVKGGDKLLRVRPFGRCATARQKT